MVVAIGGGSALDLAKAAAMLLGNGGDPMDYLEVVGRGQPISRPSVPLVAVPTTAGTGAEVTANAVLARAGARAQGQPAPPPDDPRDTRSSTRELTLDCPPGRDRRLRAWTR